MVKPMDYAELTDIMDELFCRNQVSYEGSLFTRAYYIWEPADQFAIARCAFLLRVLAAGKDPVYEMLTNFDYDKEYAKLDEGNSIHNLSIGLPVIRARQIATRKTKE